jgi:molybdate transport system permease protein
MSLDLSPLWVSLKVACIATAITFFLGIVAAYWMLGFRGRSKALIEGFFISPLILPPTVVGFLLLLLFGRNGVFGPLIDWFNLTIVFTWYAAVISSIVVAFPLMYRTALGAFEQIDANLLGVARTLGASEWMVFWRIVVPLAIPGILAGTTLTFARALGEFGATLMLAGNIPGQTQTIPMAIYFAVEAGAMDEAWFWTIVIISLSLSVITGVNGWQNARTKRRSRRSTTRSATDWITYVTDVRDHKLSGSSGLSIDIEKQLPEFRLKVAFYADENPLGVLGGSGAGKSMLLRCIAGIESPTRGQIVLNQRVLFDAAKNINVPSCDRRIGFLVQNYALFPHMTVAQNIAFGLPKGLSKLAIRQQIEAQLAAVHLQEYRDRYPSQLSGGQQQRVALARALASQPEALLLDEPFSALDTFLRSQIEQQMIARLQNYQGVTLFVTHNLEEAYRVCPNLLVMDQGQAIAHGTKQSIFEHPRTFKAAQLTGCKNFSEAVATDSNQIQAIDWAISLTVAEALPDHLAYIGIRAHQIIFLDQAEALPNTFPCWLASTSETPHRMTLFLKFNSPAIDAQDYHVQAEVFKEKWFALKAKALPWQVQLDPLRLMLMESQE